jgi:hypothetical protein
MKEVLNAVAIELQRVSVPANFKLVVAHDSLGTLWLDEPPPGLRDARVQLKIEIRNANKVDLRKTLTSFWYSEPCVSA